MSQMRVNICLRNQLGLIVDGKLIGVIISMLENLISFEKLSYSIYIMLQIMKHDSRTKWFVIKILSWHNFSLSLVSHPLPVSLFSAL